MLLIQICLSHTMKIFSHHAKKHIKRGNRTTVMYAYSLIAHSKCLSGFQDAVEHMFTLSKKENDIFKNSKRWIDKKVLELGCAQESEKAAESSDDLKEIANSQSNNQFSEDPRKEDVYLRKCKRSNFYQLALQIHGNIRKILKQKNVSISLFKKDFISFKSI